MALWLPVWMAFLITVYYIFLVVKELESERELSHVEIFASGGDAASKLQVQDDSQIVDLVRTHHMFSRILNFLFLFVFIFSKKTSLKSQTSE